MSKSTRDFKSVFNLDNNQRRMKGLELYILLDMSCLNLLENMANGSIIRLMNYSQPPVSTLNYL